MNDLFLSQGFRRRKSHCSEWGSNAFEWMNFERGRAQFPRSLARGVQHHPHISHPNFKARVISRSLYKPISAYNLSHLKE